MSGLPQVNPVECFHSFSEGYRTDLKLPPTRQGILTLAMYARKQVRWPVCVHDIRDTVPDWGAWNEDWYVAFAPDGETHLWLSPCDVGKPIL